MRKVPKKKSKSWTSSADSDSSSSSADEYCRESKLMRLKAYDNLKVPGLPKSAAELRTWKNGLISQLVACCGSSERELLTWLAKPFEGEEILPSDEFAVLNRVIGSKILDRRKRDLESNLAWSQRLWKNTQMDGGTHCYGTKGSDCRSSPGVNDVQVFHWLPDIAGKECQERSPSSGPYVDCKDLQEISTW